MNETTTPQNMRLALPVCLAVAAALFPTSRAQAQATPPAAAEAGQGDVQEVVVTGSHIKQSTNAHPSSPVETLGRDDLESTPRSTLGDFVVESTINSGSFSSGEKTAQS